MEDLDCSIVDETYRIPNCITTHEDLNRLLSEYIKFLLTLKWSTYHFENRTDNNDLQLDESFYLMECVNAKLKFMEFLDKKFSEMTNITSERFGKTPLDNETYTVLLEGNLLPIKDPI